MNVSEATMQEIVNIMDHEIGPTFKIDDLATITNLAKERCEAAGGREEDLPGIFAEELQKFKSEHKLFGYGRFCYAYLFEDRRASA